MRPLWSLTLVGLLVVGAGCARNRVMYVPYSAGWPSEKSPGSPVLLTSENQLGQPVEELGMLFATARSAYEYDKVAGLLKEKARRVGADAVIKVKYGEKQVFGVNPLFFSLPYHVTTGEGIAVRYVTGTEKVRTQGGN